MHAGDDRADLGGGPAPPARRCWRPRPGVNMLSHPVLASITTGLLYGVGIAVAVAVIGAFGVAILTVRHAPPADPPRVASTQTRPYDSPFRRGMREAEERMRREKAEADLAEEDARQLTERARVAESIRGPIRDRKAAAASGRAAQKELARQLEAWKKAQAP